MASKIHAIDCMHAYLSTSVGFLQYSLLLFRILYPDQLLFRMQPLSGTRR